MSNLDFSAVRADHEVSVKIEKSESAGDAKVRQVKDLALFFFALIGVFVLLGMCAVVALDKTSSADDKKWATSVLTAVVGGLVGYLVRK